MQKYNGFNLIVGDFGQRKLAYLSNRSGQGPQQLAPGFFGISNGVLESRWPKVEKGKARLQQLLEGSPSEKVSMQDVFLQVMSDRTRVSPEEGLPQTGLPELLEVQMSSIFLDQFELNGQPYGTRSQTVLLVNRDGTAELHEKSLHKDYTQSGTEPAWTDVHHSFQCSV